MKKKGGLLASICETGQEKGMNLTRAAFAVMIKFAGLFEKFDNLVDTLELEQTSGNIPAEPGPDQNTKTIQVLESVSGCDEVAKCWANATQMRRWLTQKKQSLGQKSKNKEDLSNEEAEL